MCGPSRALKDMPLLPYLLLGRASLESHPILRPMGHSEAGQVQGRQPQGPRACCVQDTVPGCAAEREQDDEAVFRGFTPRWDRHKTDKK